MPGEAMQRENRGLVITGAVQVRTIIFKMFIDLESRTLAGSVLEQN